MELGVSDFLKYLMAGPGRSLLFALWLLAGVVSASAQTSAPTPTATATVTAAPDPITFGYAVERGDLRTVTRWLDEGEGAFHDTVVGRPMVEVPLSVDGSRNGDKGG